MALVGSISGSAGLNIGVTGSVIFSNKAGSNGSLFPATLPGGDVYFFVSGSTTGKNNTAEKTVAVFGGDTVISGSLTVGTGSITITSNEIQFLGGAAKITSSSAGLTFFDSNNTGGKSLTELAAGGGTGTNFFLDTAGAGKIYTTASSVAFPFGEQIGGFDLNEAADKGSDVKFYVSGSGQVVGLAGSTVSLFGGNIVTSGSFVIKDSAGAGNATLLLTNAGDITVDGNIDTLSAENKTLFASAGANNVTIGGSSSTVVVPGNLTVNGTTTTLNTENLLVKDPIILMASGAAGPNRDGGIAIFSGSDGGGLPDLVFGKVAADVWGAGKLSTNNGTVGSLTGMVHVPIRAGAFQVGGATAYVSSSDAQNLIVNSNASTTFANGGSTALVQIGALNSNQGAIFGHNGTPGTSTINRLWVSGTRVDLAHSLSAANQGIGIVGNNAQGGLLRISDIAGVKTFNIEARDELDTVGRLLALSGSTVSVGASDENGTVTFARQGSTHLTITSDAANSPRIAATTDLRLKAGGNDFEFFGNTDAAAFLKFTTTDVGGANNALISGSSNGNVTLGSSGTGVTTLSGSNVILNHSNGVFIQRNGSSALGINSGAGTTTISGSANNSNVTLGAGTGTGVLNLSGSTINANSGVGGFVFQRDGVAELHVNAASGITTISGSAGQAVTLGAGTGANLTLSGSIVTLNGSAAVDNGVSFLKDGVLFAKAGVTSDGITGLYPSSDSGASLGSPARRWANVYTGDLHLRNDRGNWTIIEEEEYLSITNNISGKRYKFVLEEI